MIKLLCYAPKSVKYTISFTEWCYTGQPPLANMIRSLEITVFYKLQKIRREPGTSGGVWAALGLGPEAPTDGPPPHGLRCCASIPACPPAVGSPRAPCKFSVTLKPFSNCLGFSFFIPTFPWCSTANDLDFHWAARPRSPLASWRLACVFPKPLHSFRAGAAPSFSGWLSSQPLFTRGLSCHNAALSSLVTLAKSNYFLCVLVSTSTKWNNIICYKEISGFMRSFGKHSKVLYTCLQFFILNILRMQCNQDNMQTQ